MLRKRVPGQTSCPPPWSRPDSLRAAPVGHISPPSLRHNVFPQGVSQSLRWVFLAQMSAALTPRPSRNQAPDQEETLEGYSQKSRPLNPENAACPHINPIHGQRGVDPLVELRRLPHQHHPGSGKFPHIRHPQEKSTPPEECRSAGVGSVLGHPAWGVPGRCFRTWGE